MATILPKKAGFEQPMALDDDHHEALAADPSIQQFPQGSSYGTNTSFGGGSAFGSPSAGGFGSSGSFGSTNSGFGSAAVNNFGGLQQQQQP